MSNEEDAFVDALRQHGGEAGDEMSFAFKKFQLGLTRRIDEVALDLHRAVVEQGAAGRQARWISGATLALALGFGGAGLVLFKDIGRLEVKSDNLSSQLKEIDERVDSVRLQIEEVLETVKIIDNRTQDMADQASVEPGFGYDDSVDQLLSDSGDGAGQVANSTLERSSGRSEVEQTVEEILIAQRLARTRALARARPPAPASSERPNNSEGIVAHADTRPLAPPLQAAAGWSNLGVALSENLPMLVPFETINNPEKLSAHLQRIGIGAFTVKELVGAGTADDSTLRPLLATSLSGLSDWTFVDTNQIDDDRILSLPVQVTINKLYSMSVDELANLVEGGVVHEGFVTSYSDTADAASDAAEAFPGSPE